MFTDAFKSTDGWVSSKRNGCGAGQPWNCGPSLNLDSDGWVRSLTPNVDNGGHVVHMVIFSGASAQYVPGQYVIKYDGSGTIAYNGWTKNAASTPGRDVLDLAPGNTGNVFLTITATDPTNYIRNIQVLMPGYASHAGLPPQFHPDFLSSLQMYRKGTLRFMDLMNTNHSPYTSWSNYPTLADATWSGGLPMEKVAELCNLMSTNCWINVPHQFSDNDVRQMAQVLYANLNSGLKVYIEYSNETWNSIFKQQGDMARQGCGRYSDLAAGCAQDNDTANPVLCEGFGRGLRNPSCTTAGQRYFSERSVEIWDIFESVFGGTSRLVRVMASQAASSGLSGIYLSWNNAYLKTDALAIAPYFAEDVGRDPNAVTWSLNQLFTHITNFSLPTNTYSWVDKNVNLLNNSNYAHIKLIAYEGGQHLAGIGSLQNDLAIETLFKNANRDPQMKTAYTQYLSTLQAKGLKELVHFTDVGRYTKYGSWGVLEYTMQACSASPKCDALASFIAANP